MLRHEGPVNWEIWDSTNPKVPTKLVELINNGTATHHGAGADPGGQ
jgi:hypothetical protein